MRLREFINKSIAESKQDGFLEIRPSGRYGNFGNESILGSIKLLDSDSDLVFDYPELEDAWYIDNIYRKAEGQLGRASHALKILTDWADENNYVLSLTAAASWGLDQDQLVAWYQRNGFQLLDSSVMVRSPQTR